MKQLTLKLAMLMALTGACRSSELAALDLSYRSFKPQGVSFKLPTLTKKRAPGAPPKELFFGAYQEEILCVVECLRQYESATEAYRGTPPSGRLFLSHVKPHKPVTSQRIAHWLKDVLEMSGIDTTIFSAHSTRGAATSAAFSKGVPISEILQTADWSGSSTFKRFYLREAETSPSFASRVLSE